MEDATSWYRGQLPIANLYRDYDVSLTYVTELKWSTVAMADVLFLQRPFDPKHLTMAQVAEKMGKKIWADWDDDLFGVPEENRTHYVYSDPEVQRSVAEICAMADMVTVSTEVLANRFNDVRRRAGKHDCVVVPNALSNHLLPKRSKPDQTRRPLVMWRGSDTHQKDLMTVTEEILQIFHDKPEFTAHFLGYNPFWITQGIRPKQCIVGAPLPIEEYHQYLGTIQAGITIVPLSDCEFNRAKSNIAWLEASYGHSQVIAPDMPEWRMPGVLNYTDGKSFKKQLLRAMREVQANDWTRVHQSWDHIEKNLLLDTVNQKRWEVLQFLVPEKFNQPVKEKGTFNEVQSYTRHRVAVRDAATGSADDASC